MITTEEQKCISTFATERLKDEQKEAIISIGALKKKLFNLPRITQEGEAMRVAEGKRPISAIRRDMIMAKMAYGTTHQLVNLELAMRRRKRNQERAAVVEKCFVDLAKERLPNDVFQDLLDEAVDKTRDSV